VKLIDYRVYTAAAVNAFTPLYAAALADGHSAVLRIDSQEAYAASVPVFASTGEAIALIEALLPTGAVDSTARALIRKLLVTALVLAALAVIAGVLLGELVARPVRALTAAATRIGAGDFSASIPGGGAAEVAALAATMEDMRRNLIELTSTLRQREAEARAVLGGIVEGVYAVDANRSIRYMNPQAARLLGVTTEEAVGRFCGDVLKPQPEDGRRPCDFRCPILKARAGGSARALESLAALPGAARPTLITSAAPVDGLQVQVMREEAGADAASAAGNPQGAPQGA
jgi:nitrogen fixation/metabolism regulation signal transduction histidine kinase